MGEPAHRRLTYSEYLAEEARSDVRHAFADGELFAMAGGTRVHAYVQTRWSALLVGVLAGKRCVPYGADLRIYLPHLGEACYADTLVVCGRFVSDPVDPDATVNPTVVCEVLSPSTEAYDRGRKFEKYADLNSLQEYVLLAQDRPWIEVFRREPDGVWSLRRYGAGATVALDSLAVGIAVDDVYLGAFDEE